MRMPIDIMSWIIMLIWYINCIKTVAVCNFISIKKSCLDNPGDHTNTHTHTRENYAACAVRVRICCAYNWMLLLFRACRVVHWLWTVSHRKFAVIFLKNKIYFVACSGTTINSICINSSAMPITALQNRINLIRNFNFTL